MTWGNVCSPGPFLLSGTVRLCSSLFATRVGSRTSPTAAAGAPPPSGLPPAVCCRRGACSRIGRLVLRRGGVDTWTSRSDSATSTTGPSSPFLRSHCRTVDEYVACSTSLDSLSDLVRRPASCDWTCPCPEGTSQVSYSSDMTCSAPGGRRAGGGYPPPSRLGHSQFLGVFTESKRSEAVDPAEPAKWHTSSRFP